MSWIELSLDTTNEAVDWVYTLLAKAIAAKDLHIRRYQQEQPAKWTYTIQIYLPKNAQIHQRINEIENILTPLHRTGLTSELQSFVIARKPFEIELDQTYANSLVRSIGDRFVIVSSYANYEASSPQEITVRLLNTLAFGSGLHPATILSLRLLERHIQPELYALDLGSGSGLLSVAMAKLGAEVLAIDNDPIAVMATEDAVQRNQVTQQVKTMCASLGSASQLGPWMGGDIEEDVVAIEADGEFDLIVANIFARVHISLAAEFHKALRNTSTHSGILITAGYTRDRAEDVSSAMIDVGFTECDRIELGEWMAIAYCACYDKA